MYMCECACVHEQLLTISPGNVSPAAGDDSQMAAISEEQTPLKKKGLSKDTVWGKCVSSDDRSRGWAVSGSAGLGVGRSRGRLVSGSVGLGVGLFQGRSVSGSLGLEVARAVSRSLGLGRSRGRSVGGSLSLGLSVTRCGPLARSLRDSQQFSARA